MTEQNITYGSIILISNDRDAPCIMYMNKTPALLFTTQSGLSMTLKKSHFENIVGKGENAGNQHFLLFPKCVLPFLT